MSFSLILILLSILAIYGAWDSRLVESCLVIGRRLANDDKGTGFQDAITPPVATNFTFLRWAIFLTLMYLAFQARGWTGPLIGLGTYLFISSLLRVTVVPKPGALHYAKIIYDSMNRRYADYVKNNDRVRANAMNELIEKFNSMAGIS